MEIKLPSSGLLLIVLSLWRLIHLSRVKFAYSAFNTLSLKFSPRTLLALFTATTLAIPGLRIRLSMVLLLQEGISDHLSYVIPSRLGVLYLVGGRVHLDNSESHRKGRSEMPLYLSEAPLVLNLTTMSKFVLNKLVSKGMLFAQTAPKSNILLVFSTVCALSALNNVRFFTSIFPGGYQICDEAHFWLNGYVNKQNCRIWSEANPQAYVETQLHPEKLTVWCALWAGGILLQKR
ncbi:hypothetical protein TNCV_1451091 [Trichonephila clavipes]|nr:hypothetical protein TNCV_1451091 [Trichonephila clavipes]